jgi:ATPase family associated with various cellular activities (AAA)
MTYTETHTVTLIKNAKRNLQENVVLGNIQNIIASTNNKSLLVRGWTVATDVDKAWAREMGTEDGYQYRYTMNLVVKFSREDNRPPNNHEFPTIVRTVNSRAKNPAYGRWEVGFTDGDEYVPTGERAEEGDLIGYTPVEIPADWDKGFDHLYGLKPHITMIKKALQAGIDSNWQKRFHCALIGAPGCGKSDVSKTVKAMLGDDAVLEYDATAMTSAGVIDDLKSRDILPRVVIVEEIEKVADQNSLSMLLAMLDLRGEIRKTTARGKIERDTKVFVIATVNNYPLFKKLLSGALESRFANKIFFKRPSRETLAMILERECRDNNGSYDWIQPTLNYCDQEGITDPRQVISLCLTGAEDWMNGEFIAMLDATSEPRAEIEDEPSPIGE